jgi:hypothetical protein
MRASVIIFFALLVGLSVTRVNAAATSISDTPRYDTNGISAVLVMPVSFTSDDKPLAIVRRFKPEVLVRFSNQRTWVQAEMAQQLFDRDTLRTGEDGYAVVQLVDNSIARVRPNSLLIIRGEVNDRDGVNSRISVESGSMNISVTGRQSEYEILTPTGVAAIKGTQISATVNDDGSSTFICFTGEVLVSAVNTGQQVSLTRRRRAIVDPMGNTIRVESVSRREVRRIENEETNMQEAATPKFLRFRMMNAAGEIVDVEIPYFEQDPQK